MTQAVNNALHLDHARPPSPSALPTPPSGDRVTKSLLEDFGNGAAWTAAGLAGAATSVGQTPFAAAGLASFGLAASAAGGALTGLTLDELHTAVTGQHLGAAVYDWTHGVEE